MAKVKKRILKQIDAKDRTSPKSSHKTLEEIWGVVTPKYNTPKIEKYEAALKKLNVADLQRECIRVGRMPHESRDRMIEALLKEFQNYINGLKATAMQPEVLEVSQEGKSLLAKLGGNKLVY